MKSKNGIITIILAMLAGLGLGMLLAPKSGKQSRRDIASKFKSWFK